MSRRLQVLWLKTIKITEIRCFREFNFSEGINHIYSHKNHYGKTLLLRFILYGLGFSIPNLKQVSLGDCRIQLTIMDGSESIEVKRDGKTITVSGRGIKKSYILPRETQPVLKHIFDIDNPILLNNILGSMFIEQSRGWTLYNQGNVIGDNRFMIDEFVKSFSNTDNDDLFKQKYTLNKELEKYKKLLSLLSNKETLEHYFNNVDVTEINALQSKINLTSLQLNLLNKEKRRLEESKRNNKKFLEYIDQMKLVISVDEKEYLLQHNMIVSSEDTTRLVDTRLQNVSHNIKIKKNELDSLQADLDKKLRSDDGDKLIKSLSILPASELNIDIEKIKSMEKLTENALVATQKKIDETAMDDKVIETIDGYIKKNLCMMDLNPEDYFSGVDQICMIHKELKQYAGTYLTLMVLAFRLSYLSTIMEKIGINLPLIIDSPRNGEIDSDNIAKIIKILNQYGKKHQIIIASIDSLEGLNVDKKITLDSLKKLINNSIDSRVDTSFFE